MKSQNIDSDKNLSIAKETVLQLDEEQLGNIAGGKAAEEQTDEQVSCIGYYCE